ncbi:MAG TPA: HI1506-related protein [Kaistia sp.]|nr:HI1506-related protein [Kaistia sp.]
MSIRILCKQPGFRRGGIAHAADTTWPADFFSAEQLAQILAEPKLIVTGAEDAVDDLLAEAGRLTIEAMASLRRDLAGDEQNTQEGRSGTAREAPSADSGSTDAPASAPVDGAQLAAPQVSPEPAPGGPTPDGQPANTTETLSADPAGAPEDNPDTGQSLGNVPGAASDAAPPKKPRKG